MEHTAYPIEFYNQVSKACDLILSRSTQEALDLIETLQREQPESAEVLFIMGIAAVTMDEFGRGLIFIEEAHNRDPDCYEYAEVLANLHVRVGNLTEGVYFAKLSTTLEPHPHVRNLMPNDLSNFFESLENASIPRHYAVGFMKFVRHEYQDAIREFDRQLLLTPDNVDCHRDASAARLMVGEFEKSISHIQKAVSVSPENPDTQYRAGRVSQRIGAWDAALFHYKNALESDDDSLDKAVAIYAAASLLPNVREDDLAQMLTEVQKRRDTTPERPEEAVPSMHRKDRVHIGYVTNSGWKADTIAVLEPLLQLHDRQKFEIHLYQQSQGRSAYIQQLNNQADFERPIWELDDETAAVIVCGDEIDILVNMCDPEPDNRISLFNMRLAAIQISYLGMNFGLGIPEIDHVIADPMTEDAMNSRLGRDQTSSVLRPGLWGVNPSYMLPEISTAPSASHGYLTFGAMCDLEGLTPDAIQLLVDAMNAAPDSRLIFGAAGTTDTYPKRKIRELFAGTGLGDRVSIWDDKGLGDPWNPDPAFWQAVDVFLVPGALTAPLRVADALWMGIPALVLRGDTPQSCSGGSILASATRPEWLINSATELVSRVKEFSSDLPGLANSRATQRDELRNTALFNPVARVRELEDLYIKLVDARDAAA